MFAEDLIARVALNLARIIIVVIAAYISARQSLERGKLYLLPVFIAIGISLGLSFAERPLADWIYSTFF